MNTKKGLNKTNTSMDPARGQRTSMLNAGTGSLLRPKQAIEPSLLLFRLFWGLILFEIFLTGAYLVNHWIGDPIESIGALIDLDRESAIGTWLSSTQLFSIGALFLGMRLLVGKGSVGRLFMALGLGFLFLSMDETAVVHEKITGVLKRFAWAPRVADNHGLWIPVYFLVAAAFLLCFCKPIGTVIRRFPGPTWVFLGGALVMVLGGVFLEVLGYYHFFDTMPTIGIAFEELGEMTGESIMLLGAGICYLKEKGAY